MCKLPIPILSQSMANRCGAGLAISCLLGGAFAAVNHFNFLMVDVAFAAGTFSTPPPSLGGSRSGRGKLAASSSAVKVEERSDTLAAKKKQPLSEREKREAKGNRVSRSEIETMAVERELGQALDKEIAGAEKLIGNLPKSSQQRPEILRRLVENYHQKAMLIFFEDSRSYDVAWKRWDEAGRRGVEPVLDIKRSKAWTSKVIQKAMQLITEYAKHPRIDEAYFQIAFAYDAMEQPKEAASYYSQIVKKFPNSKRIPDAHYALGEYYFGKLEFKQALTSFREIERFSLARIYPWALYKSAWCYYNLQDYRNALQAFQRVVVISAGAPGMSKNGRMRLKDEALREMVNVYAELDDLKGAEAYFMSVGGEKYYGDLLMRLADLLRERGQYERSVEALKGFVSRNPTAFKAAELQIQMVDTAYNIPDKRLFWSEMKLLLDHFKPNSPWGNRNSSNKEFKPTAEKIHTVALSYAKKFHSLGQKDNSRFNLEQAKFGYSLYLRHYEKRTEALEARYLLAELLYQDNKFSEAIPLFSTIANLKEKSPYFQKAGDYMLSSAFLPAEGELKAMRAKAAKLAQPPVPLSRTLQEYLRVCDQFVGLYPKDPKVLDCNVDTAEIQLKNNHYAESEKRLFVVAKTYPTKPEGKAAAEILLFLSSADNKKLLARADEIGKIPQYAEGELGKRIASIKEASKFENTLALEKGGKFIQAAKDFERIATENPNGQRADAAWYNAGVNYRKGSEPQKAINAFGNVYRNYPKSAQAADAILNIVEMSSDQLQLAAAANHSLLFLQRFPNDKRSPVVSRETCFLYDALNDVQKAELICRQVMKSKDTARLDAAKALADCYERNGRHAPFVALVDETILHGGLRENEKIEYLLRAQSAERKMGKSSAAKAREDQIMRVYNSNTKVVDGVGLSEVGRISFEKELPALQKFKNTKIEAKKADGSDLMKTTQVKMAAVQQVENAFKRVVATGDPEWGVASLFTVAAAYELLAYDLKTAPMPPTPAKESERKVYAEQVKMIREKFTLLAKEPEEKAKKLYLEAMSVVSKGAVYTEYSRKTFAALVRIAPKEFHVIEEWLPESLFVGSQWMDAGPGVHKAIQQLGGGSHD